MVMQKTCDAGDNNPGAYLITDLSNGDTAIWCAGHWIDLCAQVTRAAEEQIAASAPAPVEPQPVDPVAPDVAIDPVDPVEGRVGQGDGIHLDEHGETIAALDTAIAQEARVHAELAARPDSAPTSEQVTWSPDDDAG